MIYIDAFFMLIPTSISTWAKGLFRSIEFYKHKMMAVDRCPLLPIDLDSHAKHQIILKYFLDVLEEGLFGVDDISLLLKRVFLVLVENSWPPFCCTFYTSCEKLGYKVVDFKDKWIGGILIEVFLVMCWRPDHIRRSFLRFYQSAWLVQLHAVWPRI